MLTSGPVLSTITVRVPSPRFPAWSFPRATIVVSPSAKSVVSHDMTYGGNASTPTALPFARNATSFTTPSSLALARMSMDPRTICPAGGSVIVTTGGVWSATMTSTGSVAKGLPAASYTRAVAVSVAVPDATVVTQSTVQGGESAVPMIFPSARNSTAVTARLSDASASTWTRPPTTAPGSGLTMTTVGGLGSTTVTDSSSLGSKFPLE